MQEEFTQLARESSTEQLLHMLQESPDDWSPIALECARAELRVREVAWTEKPATPPASVPLLSKVLYFGLGIVTAIVMVVLVTEFHVRPRWLFLVAALSGALGVAVPRHPRL